VWFDADNGLRVQRNIWHDLRWTNIHRKEI